MNSKKTYFVMISITGILVIGIFVAIYLGNSLLEKSSDKLVQAKLTNEVLDAQQTSLLQANKDLDTYAELENITKSIVPQDKDQAKTVREIIKIADENGISIANMSFPTSSLGTAVPKTNDGAQTAPSVPITQVKPVEGIPGVYQMEITIQSDQNRPVSYGNLINFLSALEQNRRTAQVTQINITPKTSNINQLTFNIVINVFIKP